MKVSDYVVEFLRQQGVTHIYELSGGMIAHLLDSIARSKAVRAASMHHEQGAGFAAEAHARVTGVPAVAMATSGPGAINLLTPLGSCYFDSVPAVFITGQVNRHERKGERKIRQLGFQETDIVAMARPITKDARTVLTPEEVPSALARAFELALSGRPGPVLLDIPMDVQRGVLDVPAPTRIPARAPAPLSPDKLREPLRRLAEAKRPLVLVGGGIRSALSTDLCRRALERLDVPVVESLMGLDVLGHDHPLRVGFLGSYGNRWTNLALGEADFLLVVGSRLDIRQTGNDVTGFAKGKYIVHVDCDPGEINNRVTGVDPIVSQLADFFTAMLAVDLPRLELSAWRTHLDESKERWPDTQELSGIEGLNPNMFLRRLGEASRAASAFVTDVGQHQMWAAQSLVYRTDQRFLTSGGMGSMGFGLPAAVGAAIAMPSRSVVLIAGDGGFQSNIQELQTVRRNDLPIKIVILNNRSHGMVRQFQESYFESRFQSTVDGYDAPDFARLAEAYRIPGRHLAGATDRVSPDDRAIEEALAWLWQDPLSPALLAVDTPMSANVYPKLAFGRPITEMEPFFKPIDMEGT